MAGIIAIDFGGTLVKASMIEQAGILRTEILETAVPSRDDHAREQRIYKRSRDAINAMTGVTDEMTIASRDPDGDDVELSGTQFQNVLSTTLFGLGLLQVAKEHGQDIYAEGMLDTLAQLKQRGYELAVVSGVRRDLISAVLAVTEVDLFDYIEGQPATLGLSNEQLLVDLKDYGGIAYVIGDKLSDLDPAHAVDAEAIFVTWGHPSGGEEALADHSADEPTDLLDIIA